MEGDANTDVLGGDQQTRERSNEFPPIFKKTMSRRQAVGTIGAVVASVPFAKFLTAWLDHDVTGLPWSLRIEDSDEHKYNI